MMRIPKSDEGRFFSITQAFQQDEDPYAPDPWLARAAFLCGVALVLFVWISWAVLA